MRRVVMEGHEVFNLGQRRESQGMRQGTMVPANMVDILFCAVLGVMAKQVHTSGECVA